MITGKHGWKYFLIPFLTLVWSGEAFADRYEDLAARTGAIVGQMDMHGHHRGDLKRSDAKKMENDFIAAVELLVEIDGESELDRAQKIELSQRIRQSFVRSIIAITSHFEDAIDPDEGARRWGYRRDYVEGLPGWKRLLLRTGYWLKTTTLNLIQDGASWWWPFRRGRFGLPSTFPFLGQDTLRSNAVKDIFDKVQDAIKTDAEEIDQKDDLVALASLIAISEGFREAEPAKYGPLNRTLRLIYAGLFGFLTLKPSLVFALGFAGPANYDQLEVARLLVIGLATTVFYANLKDSGSGAYRVYRSIVTKAKRKGWREKAARSCPEILDPAA